VQQVFRIERHIVRLRTGEVRDEVVYGLTSLPPGRGPAATLLAYNRAHWHIENRSHWVRDVTFDEDCAQVRVGNVPEVLAALRNTTISLLRLAGATNLAAACRRHAAQPWEALALLGITPNN
jgi:hypothetical protein